MKKYKKIKEKVTKKECISISCNKCGKTKKSTNQNDLLLSGIETFTHGFGYGSDRDGEDVEFDLCPKCFNKIISKFKIKPKIIQKW